MLESLKEKVYIANLELYKKGMVIYTWGNVSGITSDRKHMVIKPSGVEYDEMKSEDMVVVELDTGEVLEGNLKPSSDTPTHIEIYRNFPLVNGVVHTHSINAVAFAQAGIDLQALGTTHADYFYGPIPCTRSLSEREVNEDYEKNTGRVIAETFFERKLDSISVPGVLVKNHGPFAWGSSPSNAVHNAIVMESVAEMGIKTLFLASNATMPKYILEKHYKRKHGANAYYGQYE